VNISSQRAIGGDHGSEIGLIDLELADAGLQIFFERRAKQDASDRSKGPVSIAADTEHLAGGTRMPVCRNHIVRPQRVFGTVASAQQGCNPIRILLERDQRGREPDVSAQFDRLGANDRLKTILRDRRTGADRKFHGIRRVSARRDIRRSRSPRHFFRGPFACKALDLHAARTAVTWWNLRDLLAKPRGPVKLHRSGGKSHRPGMQRATGVFFDKYGRNTIPSEEHGRRKAYHTPSRDEH
jgi:hypothetical protein